MACIQSMLGNDMCRYAISSILQQLTRCADMTQVWRQTLWTDIRTDVMEEGTKAFVKEVKGLPKAIRDEDCFKVTYQLELTP